MSSLTALRATSDANSAEQKRIQDRKRNILVLMYTYLIENGYVETAEKLSAETNAMCSRFEVADNVDLGLILVEYENYYEMRYDRKPKLIRKLIEGEEPKFKRPLDGKGKNISKKSVDPPISKLNISDDAGVFEMGVQGTKVSGKKDAELVNASKLEDRVLKPPPQFGSDPEMKQLVGAVSREIYQHSPNVLFEDIIGLENAKRLLKEAIQLPLSYPSIFTGILKPWKGILLHGPPGVVLLLLYIICCILYVIT
jgi:katanin p60 ATPase-containing subunit A1